MVTGKINVREYRRPKGQSKKDNPEELTTMVTGQIRFPLRYSPPFICSVAIVVSYSGLSFFDYPSVFGILHRTMVTGQINVREYRRPKGQSKKDNPE
jgi:hypothetical protein